VEIVGRGFAARVYKVERDGSIFALKEFSPTSLACLVHRILRWTEHPYSTERGVRMAFHRRRIASRLSRMWDQQNYIVDAVAMNGERSFLCQYAEGKPVSRRELDQALAFASRLKRNLREAGLPTTSLEGLPRKYVPKKLNKVVDTRNLLVDKDGFFKLIDFESGIPRMKGGRFVLDHTDFEKLGQYLRDIADEELRHEFELLRQYTENTRKH
jgi:hypothetical protein